MEDNDITVFLTFGFGLLLYFFLQACIFFFFIAFVQLFSSPFIVFLTIFIFSFAFSLFAMTLSFSSGPSSYPTFTDDGEPHRSIFDLFPTNLQFVSFLQQIEEGKFDFLLKRVILTPGSSVIYKKRVFILENTLLGYTDIFLPTNSNIAEFFLKPEFLTYGQHLNKPAHYYVVGDNYPNSWRGVVMQKPFMMVNTKL